MKKAFLAFLFTLQLTSVNANPDITPLLKTLEITTKKVNEGFAKMNNSSFFRLDPFNQMIFIQHLEKNNINKNKLTQKLISIIQKSPNPDELLNKLIETITQLGPNDDGNMRLLHDVLSSSVNEQTTRKFVDFACENSVSLCKACSSKILSFPKLKEEYHIKGDMIYSNNNNTNSDSENEDDSNSDSEDEDEDQADSDNDCGGVGSSGV